MDFLSPTAQATARDAGHGAPQDAIRAPSLAPMQRHPRHCAPEKHGDQPVLHQQPPSAASREALARYGRGPRPLRRHLTVQSYAVRASLPDFVAERFLAQFGDEAEQAAAAMNSRAPLFPSRRARRRRAGKRRRAAG